MTTKIVVLDGQTLNPGDNPWNDIERFGETVVYERSSPDEIVSRAADAEIIVTNKAPVDASTLSHLPKLKLIAVTATGHNVVDSIAAREQGVTVTNVPEYGTDSVAQHVFALLLSLIHRPEEHDDAIRNGQWASCGDFSFTLSPPMELANRIMGIVGFGRIGRRVGEIAHTLGMKVMASSNSRQYLPPYKRQFDYCSIEQLFAESDVVTLHCPLTEHTAGMVNKELLDRMKPSAYLINTARGGLINEADLADALNSGKLAGAGLDVVSKEPITDDNPLLDAKNCLLTPHNAWATLSARRRLMQATADNIEAFLAGLPINVVNS